MESEVREPAFGQSHLKRRMLEPLPQGIPFSLKYERARIDRNALYVMNQCFSPESIAAVRTKYHRSSLNFEDLKTNLLEYDCPRPPINHGPAYYAAFQSVRRDFGLHKEKLIPLTTGAVVKHPDLPGAKSPGLPYKLQGFNTKREALSDPAVVSEIRQKWYDIGSGKHPDLADVGADLR